MLWYLYRQAVLPVSSVRGTLGKERSCGVWYGSYLQWEADALRSAMASSCDGGIHVVVLKAAGHPELKQTTRARCLIRWQPSTQPNPCLSEVPGKHGLMEQPRTPIAVPTVNGNTPKTVIFNKTLSSYPVFLLKGAKLDKYTLQEVTNISSKSFWQFA